MYYINREGKGHREAADEFETKSEALAMVREYQMSDPSAKYWASSRACKNWSEK